MKATTQTNPTWRSFAPTLILQVVVPIVAYQLLHHNGVSAVDSLAIIAGGSAVVLVARWIYERSVDPLGVFILGAIVLGVLAALITGSARVTLLRDSVITGGFGIVYIGSLFIGKPLTFHFGRRFAGVDEARWDDLWKLPDFRHSHRLMTAVWGVGLVLEAAVRIVLVFTLSVSVMQSISTLMAAVTIGALSFWSVSYGKRMRRRGLERRGLVETPSGEVVAKAEAPATSGAPGVPAPTSGRVGIRSAATGGAAAAPTET